MVVTESSRARTDWARMFQIKLELGSIAQRAFLIKTRTRLDIMLEFGLKVLSYSETCVPDPNYARIQLDSCSKTQKLDFEIYKVR